ncbi:MAG: helix-turn-helix transcriptional regulator [Cyclobacteriaceae bacterium]
MIALKVCQESLKAITDTLYVVGGKWKLPIVFSLNFGEMRFSELEKEIPNITARMLSKELKELEQNHIVDRVVHQTMPIRVTYKLTDHGESLKPVFESMKEWGLMHRAKVFGR